MSDPRLLTGTARIRAHGRAPKIKAINARLFCVGARATKRAAKTNTGSVVGPAWGRAATPRK